METREQKAAREAEARRVAELERAVKRLRARCDRMAKYIRDHGGNPNDPF